jgi:hypothetical protein
MRPKNLGDGGHHLPLVAHSIVDLVPAVWSITSQKNVASPPRGLKDALGSGSYETAWAWLHKLRRAMVWPERELLDGVAELDQSFLGGRATGKRGPSSDKAPAVA